MRISKLITKTTRSDPTEVETASHRLMVRAGMIHQVAAGVYSYLPLAWRSLRKIENIIRQEMDAAGGQEIRMPVLQPIEIWDKSGRAAAFGDNLFTFDDRRGRKMVMAPTHEEVVSNIAKSYIHSYRDLPAIVYQIQTKFRDEPRPRGGLIRVREFDMKDAYSLDADEAGLEVSYQAMAKAYRNIYKRCGLPTIMVEADSGAIGGKDSHEFILPADSGEDTIINCPQCGYSANLEKAQAVRPQGGSSPEKPLEEVSTPGVKTIDELVELLGVSTTETLKAVFYSADNETILVVIRGDLEVNEIKLKNYLNVNELRLAKKEEVQIAGLIAGSASPVGLDNLRKISDESIQMGSNFVAGANKENFHLCNTNYPRDFAVDVTLDIAQAEAGQKCINCDSTLQAIRGIEVGHIFKLGDFFSRSFDVEFLNQQGQQDHVLMGCYGIGVGRLLAAAIEQNHDEDGIIFPNPIAPYQVQLIALNLTDTDVSTASEDLYNQLWDSGIECLYDDRIDESAGVKFKDSDLLGLPVRIIISPRTLKRNSIELKIRSESESTIVPIEKALDQVKCALTL